MTTWDSMTPEEENKLVEKMKANELKGFFSPIRAAYGIPENVPIIKELDRRFQRMEAEIKELEDKNLALEAFARGATAIGGDQIETINRYREALQCIADAVSDEYGILNPASQGFTGEIARALLVLSQG